MDYELLNVEEFNLIKGNDIIDVYDVIYKILPHLDWLIEKSMESSPECRYLTFEALESGTFKFTNAGLSYSIDDGSTWTALAANTNTPTVNTGERIMFKGEITPQSGSGIGRFISTGEFNASGNVMSLLYGDDFVYNAGLTGKSYAFYQLFSSNTKLVSAEKLILPARTLSDHCYYEMFKDCSGLTYAPKLQSKRLATYCYGHMFWGCTSLETAPALPATTLATYCYTGMFYGCTSLETAPALPATTLTTYCYAAMFRNCTSLTTAPDLPAKKLAMVCYNDMFNGCSNLNYIKAMFTDTTLSERTNNWVSGVAATGTFVKNSEATWDVTGVNGVPSGWTVQTESA